MIIRGRVITRLKEGERFYCNVCCTYLVQLKLVVHAGNREMYRGKRKELP